MDAQSSPKRRLSRAERRRSIAESAAEAFVETGSFAATTIDALSERAGVTRAILYRHFATKTDLYTAALRQAGEDLRDATTDPQGRLHEHSVARIRQWAQQHRSGFILLFRDAAREPDFHDHAVAIRTAMAETLWPSVAELEDDNWSWWRTQLAVSTLVEAILLWLDAGGPEPDQVDAKIMQALAGML